MASEQKPIRLSKAAREFNVGIHTLVEFLAKKGHPDVSSNPNTRIEPELYQLLEQEFQSQKTVKQQSQKKAIDYSGHQTITIDDKVKEGEPEEIGRAHV